MIEIPRLSKHFTPESILKMSRSSMKGEGTYRHYHNYAGLYHRKDKCEECGKIQPKNKRLFDMHCHSNDYTNMDEKNWSTLCQSCHLGLHAKLRKLKRNKKIVDAIYPASNIVLCVCTIVLYAMNIIVYNV